MLFPRDPKSAVMAENTVTTPPLVLFNVASVTRTVCLPAVAGAVYTPVPETVPTVPLPPAMLSTVKLTFVVSGTWQACASNFCCPPTGIDAT